MTAVCRAMLLVAHAAGCSRRRAAAHRVVQPLRRPARGRAGRPGADRRAVALCERSRAVGGRRARRARSASSTGRRNRPIAAPARSRAGRPLGPLADAAHAAQRSASAWSRSTSSPISTPRARRSARSRRCSAIRERGEALDRARSMRRGAGSRPTPRPMPSTRATGRQRRLHASGPRSLAAALMAEAGLTPPPGAPTGYGGFVPLEKLIDAASPTVLVMASRRRAAGRAGRALSHASGAARALSAASGASCCRAATRCAAGPSLIAAFDYLDRSSWTDALLAMRSRPSRIAALTACVHLRRYAAIDPFRDDARQRVEAVGQRGRAGLQDQRRLDLAQEAVAHRRDRVEARPRRDLRRHEFLAAPGADDDVGLRGDHVVAATRCGPWRSCARASSGNTSMPPAASISSDTQPMPEIIGSSHSSK